MKPLRISAVLSPESNELIILALTWWRHQMETFSALLTICAGNSPVPGEFPSQRPVTRSFDVFFDLCLDKRLSKQSLVWWFDTLSRPSLRHCNVAVLVGIFRAGSAVDAIKLEFHSREISRYHLVWNSIWNLLWNLTLNIMSKISWLFFSEPAYQIHVKFDVMW